MFTEFDLIDLRLMVNIADTKSVSQGAQLSCMSPPAASFRIKNLEENLAVKLLYRNSKGVKLSPAGESLVRHARVVLQELDRLRGDLQGYARGVKGDLRVFANTTAVNEYLPDALIRFLATHPAIDIDLREKLSHDIVHSVRDGKADIGIVASHVNTDDLEVFPYRKDRLVLAVPRDHSLSTKSTLSFIETLPFDHISLQEGTGIYSFLSQIAHDLNKSLRIRVHMANFDSVCRMIESGIGVGVLPESAARRYGQNRSIHIAKLTDDWAAGELRICVRSIQLLPAFAKEFLDLLMKERGR